MSLHHERHQTGSPTATPTARVDPVCGMTVRGDSPHCLTNAGIEYHFCSSGYLAKEAIEVMRKVDTLVVDKTGTLTEGKPKLVSVVPEPGIEESTLLRLAASLERGSEHPLAAAIVKGAEQREVELVDAGGFESVTGKGVQGRVHGRDVALGNRALMDAWASMPRISPNAPNSCAPMDRR